MKKHLFILSIAMASLVACTATEKKPSNFAEGTTSLPRATAEEVNVSQESIDKLFSLIEAEDQEFHSLMILRNGRVIAEKWWGAHGPDIPHVMFSVSKSFTASAIGFAVDEGLLTLDDKVISFFPQHLPEEISPYLEQLRVWDLLTMSVGHDPAARIGRETEDWIAAFLNKPFVYEPGTHFHYDSDASFILSAIIQTLTGEKLVDYLKPRLFDPLAIRNTTWDENPQGINVGGWGMHLTTEEMAKFGQLFLQNGMWNGEQLLPAGWAEEASAKQVANSTETPEEIAANPNDWNQGYGYQMWRSLHNAYRADGARGQEIIVFPDHDLVVICTAQFSDLGKAFRMIYDTLLPGMN